MIKIFLLLCSLHYILSVHAGDVAPKKDNYAYIMDVYDYDDCWDKYRVPDWEITNFSTLSDYRGQRLRRRWNIRNGHIALSQEVTNAVELSWVRYDTAVKLKKYVHIGVDQKWQFGGATITITNSVAGAIDQRWNLGDKWYHYEKSVTGAVKSEGNANTDDLAKYQREIDCWCQANRRFFPPEYCVIYDRI